MKLKNILTGIAIFLQCSVASSTSHADSSTQKDEKFFSLTELENQAKKELRPLEYVKASDDTSLAFRSYHPQQAEAIVVFYHGAGAHSGLSYNHLGEALSTEFPIAVYTPDIRGHGYSGGDRGDTPSVDQVWEDINTLVKHARTKYPKLPLYIGGHSGGAGLALNYSSYEKKSEIDGYVFLAPYFGYRSKTNHDKDKEKFEFATVKTAAFIENTMSGGRLAGHKKGVIYNYPKSVLEKNPKIVAFNTVNMSTALTPSSPQYQFSKLKEYGLWIGENDEAFDSSKVKKFADSNSDDKASKVVDIIKDENHFSIILRASQLIGLWVMGSVQEKTPLTF